MCFDKCSLRVLGDMFLFNSPVCPDMWPDCRKARLESVSLSSFRLWQLQEEAEELEELRQEDIEEESWKAERNRRR